MYFFRAQKYFYNESVLQYILCFSIFVFNTLCCVDTGEHNLRLILEEIHQITDIEGLGLNLGLHMSAISKIQDEYRSPEQQKMRIIRHWLRRKDIVPNKESCLPTWEVLADAVAKESTALSLEIRAKYCESPAQQLD